MRTLYLALIVAGWFPLFRAWQANRRTSLVHAVCWAGAAWLGWGAAFLFGTPQQLGFDPWRYVALCLTGAAGVAVLGARRPRVGAWNFVILGLLMVTLLPLGEHLFLGTDALDGPRFVFLGAALAVGIVNYMPTAVALPAFLLGILCVGECWALAARDQGMGPSALTVLHASLLILPWLAMAMWRPSRAGTMGINRRWRDFRDRFGLFWGQRLREQYNRAAAHAGLPGFLFWQGWELANDPPPTEAQAQAMLAMFQALLKRFGDETPDEETGPGPLNAKVLAPFLHR